MTTTEESRSPTRGQSKITRRFALMVSYSPSLDPIILCPLSGSACYAIGLRGPDRRAVCFVSLIAERALRWSFSVLSSIYTAAAISPPRVSPVHPPTRAPRVPRFFVSFVSGGRHFILKKKTTAKRTFVRPFFRSRCN